MLCLFHVFKQSIENYLLVGSHVQFMHVFDKALKIIWKMHKSFIFY